MKKEVWLLDTDWKNENVQIMSSGMTVLTAPKDLISVGYSNEDRIERLRLISAAPELNHLIKEAKRLINSDNLEDWQIRNFNDELELVENKIDGLGEIKKPNHCRANYEWTDDHIEKYHKKVNELKYKL